MQGGKSNCKTVVQTVGDNQLPQPIPTTLYFSTQPVGVTKVVNNRELDPESINQPMQEIQQIQKEYTQAMVELQQLEVQFQESSIVKDEFSKLDDESKIYKLIGPVLVPQEKEEADTNVAKRLEFITSQKSQAETKIEKLRERMQKAQIELREQQIKAAVDQQQQQQQQKASTA